MAHFTQTQAIGTWITGYVPPTADWQSLDAKALASINGDDGGTYAPSSVISIGGQLVSITGPTVVTGAGCPAASPGTLTTGGVSRFTLGDTTDFQDLASGHSGSTRVLVTGLAAGACAAASSLAVPGAWLASYVYPTVPLFRNRTYMAAQLLAPYFSFATAYGGGVQQDIWCPLRVHHGATLTSVSVTFRVSQPHANVPTTMPKIRVVRTDYRGGRTTLTTSTDGTGFVSVPTPASGAAWYASGGVQTLVLPCTQNNVINAALYTYHVDIMDELGGGSAWPFVAPMYGTAKAVVVNPAYVLSGVATAIDGYTPAAGDRILVVQGLSTDGLYLAAAGAWSRAFEMLSGTTVVAGSFFVIQCGQQYGGSVFQLLNGPLSVGAAALPFTLNGQATGNLWIAASATFTGITSTAFA